MDVKETITHKVGPLPLWMYVVLGAGAILVLKIASGGGSSNSGNSGVSYPPGGITDPNGGGTDGTDGTDGSSGSFSQDYRDKLQQLFTNIQKRQTLLSQKNDLSSQIRVYNIKIQNEKNAAAKKKLVTQRDNTQKKLDTTNSALSDVEEIIKTLQDWLGSNS